MNAQNEPVLIAGFVGAVLALLVAFGVPITEAQKVAILGVAGAGYLLVASFIVRSRVVPLSKNNPPSEN